MYLVIKTRDFVPFLVQVLTVSILQVQSPKKAYDLVTARFDIQLTRTRTMHAVSLLLAFAGLSIGTQNPPPPGLSFIYSLNITAGEAIPVGAGPRGPRIIFPIVAGSFAGPKLKGTIVPVGGDMALLDANVSDPLKTFTPDIRMLLMTHDGEYIYVTKSGEL